MRKVSVFNIKTTQIIPGITKCCAGSHAVVNDDGSMVMDGDCVSEGMQLMCPNHNDQVIFVFGTGWWDSYTRHDENAKFAAWCKLCDKYIKVECWSYRG